MWRSSIPARPDADLLAAHARLAGAALACSYSSSDEFDAELIAARRAAGVYGPRRHRRQVLATVAAMAAAVLVIAFVIV